MSEQKPTSKITQLREELSSQISLSSGSFNKIESELHELTDLHARFLNAYPDGPWEPAFLELWSKVPRVAEAMRAFAEVTGFTKPDDKG